MKILITGANGFIGSNLLPVLINDGHELFCISRNALNSNLKVKNFMGNFQDEVLLNEILPQVEMVIHLACSSVPENSISNPDGDVENNVLGSLVLLNKMKEFNVKKIIYVSSGGVVYGNSNQLPTDENAKLQPISSYGITKLILEQNIKLLAENYNMEYCILRISNAYGNGQHERKNQGIINIWIQNIEKGLPIQIIEDGSQVRDYIHISDIVNAFSSVIKNDINGIYNISTGVGTSLNELLILIEKKLKKSAQIQTIPNRKFDVVKNILNSEKFIKISGWKAKISLEKGIHSI